MSFVQSQDKFIGQLRVNKTHMSVLKILEFLHAEISNNKMQYDHTLLICQNMLLEQIFEQGIPDSLDLLNLI